MCTGPCREELRCRNFLFSYPDPAVFQRPRRTGCAALYVAWRWLVALYLLVLLTWTVVDTRTTRWFIYLSFWAVFVEAANFLWQAAAATHQYTSHGDPGTDISSTVPLYTKVAWLLQNVAQSVSLIVTVGYWALLYDAINGAPGALTLQIHLVNFVVILVDLSIIQVPVRLLHFYHTQLFFICYLIVAIIIWATTGEIAYSFVDVGMNPGSASGAIVGIILFVVPITHALFFLLYKVKECMCGVNCSCCCQGEKHVTPNVEDHVTSNMDVHLQSSEDNPAYMSSTSLNTSQGQMSQWPNNNNFPIYPDLKDNICISENY